MIEGLIEGSPDAIGVAVIRLDCGCKKMAAVDKNGEPASNAITTMNSGMEPRMDMPSCEG